MLASLVALLFIALQAFSIAPKGPWDHFNFAPKSRASRPTSIHSTQGNIQNAQALIGSGTATFTSNGTFVVVDFGQEVTVHYGVKDCSIDNDWQVGGQVFLHVDDSTADSRLSLSFTESTQFISPNNSDDSCRSISSMDGDGVQSLPVPLSQGQFQQTIGQQRGGFRFLTIVSNSEAPVSISNVGVHNTFMPHWQPTQVTSSHEIPIFTIPTFWPSCGMPGRIRFRQIRLMCIRLDNNLVHVQRVRTSHLWIVPVLIRGLSGWANNATGGPVEGAILVDGAKRDRWGIVIGLFAKLLTKHP